MRSYKAWILICATITLAFPNSGWCVEPSNAEILRELETLKSRVTELEKDLKQKDQEVEILKKNQSEVHPFLEDKETQEMKTGPLDAIKERLTISGLVEVGAIFEDVTYQDHTDEDASDMNLTTVEIALGLMITDWLNLETVFLYEDAIGNTAADESDVSLDVGTVFFGNPEKCPFYAVAGKMYVPFGAIETHFPDDPLVDQPMTLAYGEINEKALLLGYEKYGLSLAGYIFNSEVDESTSDNVIEDFGLDINYAYNDENAGIDLLTGVSYISNIGEGLSGVLHDTIVENYVEGLAVYAHLGFGDFFLEGEFMTALDEFAAAEIANEKGNGAEPAVWNIETGYLFDWGRPLEIGLKYGGSMETGDLGYAEKCYGICLNQELYQGVVASIAWYRDKLHSNDSDARDKRNVVCGQVGVEF